ncbi:hypothetical protein HKK55_17715 [Pseudomonas sp. ADAK18]|uniref:hypothetical protein n=1 Tax=Pseudomonas sp. ADAK18 TaxID=2730848 RepID=UPI001462FC30|nr:hypothetical protein [Pseudomonas sp. ADAK18]QJI30464.1 hypothetical protein HKK55_17715 [Pseudomonas sp. ADAK18]
MNSALLLALNAMALTALVMFHFQSPVGDDPVYANQAASHHIQQRPQLAVMTAKAQPPVQLTQGIQATASSEHWIF